MAMISIDAWWKFVNSIPLSQKKGENGEWKPWMDEVNMTSNYNKYFQMASNKMLPLATRVEMNFLHQIH